MGIIYYLVQRMPQTYRQAVLNEPNINLLLMVTANYCLATLKNYRSLMPMAMEVHKPMFHLKPADGAIGAHMQAVSECYNDFKQLATVIANNCHIQMVNHD